MSILNAPPATNLHPRLGPIPVAGRALGGVSRATVYRLLGRGDITARKIGGRLMIELDSVERYIAQAPTAKIAPPAK